MTKIPLGISKYFKYSKNLIPYLFTRILQFESLKTDKPNSFYERNGIMSKTGCSTRGVWNLPWAAHGACGFHTGRVDLALGFTRGVWNKL